MGFVRLVCLLVTLVSFSTACTRVMKENYGWRPVKNKHAVHINFNIHDLQLKTNSGLGSYQKIRMVFKNKEGKESGGVFVKFSNPPQYMIGWCSQWKLFPAQLSSALDKIWKFSKTKETVVVTCNEIEVINFTASDESCDRWPNWRYYWDRETDRVKFTKHLDKASDSYRIQLPTSNWAPIPRGFKFDLDLQRVPLDISTNSVIGSKDQISVLFYDQNKNVSGGLRVKLSTKPKFSVPYCRRSTDFHWKSVKKLREMPLEKIWTFERTAIGVRVLVNGEEILDFAVSDTFCDHRKSWETYWSRQVDKVVFLSTHDTASKSCRVQEPEEPIVTEAPRPKRKTWSPPKDEHWYGSWAPPTVGPSKHTPTRDNCWMKGVRPLRAEKILTAQWRGKEDCERLCMETLGCHVVFNPKYSRYEEGRCELFGKYDLERPRGLYYNGKGHQEMAERKCFDPEHYTSHNSTSPCGAFSWECSDRCVEISWRCDGERDCEGGEDEEDCPSYHSPFCGPDHWKCTDFHLCPDYIDPSEERYCDRCLPQRYRCNGYPNCYFGEDERPENCPDGINCGPGGWKCTDFHLCPSEGLCSGCINKGWLCDGDSDCYFGEDERPENCLDGN